MGFLPINKHISGTAVYDGHNYLESTILKTPSTEPLSIYPVIVRDSA